MWQRLNTDLRAHISQYLTIREAENWFGSDWDCLGSGMTHPVYRARLARILVMMIRVVMYHQDHNPLLRISHYMEWVGECKGVIRMLTTTRSCVPISIYTDLPGVMRLSVP